VAVRLRAVVAALLSCALLIPLVASPPASAAAKPPPKAPVLPTPTTAPTQPAPIGVHSLVRARVHTDIPTDPRKFARSHAAIARPTVLPFAHTIVHRATAAKITRGAAGIRVAGPHITPNALSPSGPESTGLAVASFVQRHGLPTATASGVSGIARRQSPRVTSRDRTTSSVDISQLNVTGVNPWWTYEQGTIPGVGHWMVNMFWQNLLIQADDMVVHNRGIDIAFRRTYNSFSNHDYVSSDGSTEIGQYGNGWTNTFDAHMSTNNCPNTGYSWAGYFGFSVYDVDGGRYDYCFNSTGQLVPPPGMQGSTLVASADGGSFYWTKKSGAQYTFYSPYYGGSVADFSGRISRLSGRNQNSYIQFSYSWDATPAAPAGDSSDSSHLRLINAISDSGRNATLRFDDFNGRRLLSTLYYPNDLQTYVTYTYDADGNLISVTRPGPNSTGQRITEVYSGYHQFLMVSGPRWNATFNGTTATDGGYVAFHMTGNTASQTDDIQSVGIMNPGPAYLNDGTGTYLQPGISTDALQYSYEQVGGEDPGMTTVSDSDGHEAVFYLDSLGRPTDRFAYTGSQWLSTSQTWDASNKTVSAVDTRGYVTDYAYDLNGNEIAVASPSTSTSAGRFRPTQLYDYDAHNNVVAWCDEVQTNLAHANWSARPQPSDSLCQAATGGTTPHVTMTYQFPVKEPFGELASMTDASGYTRRILYATAQQGGTDYGLPTDIYSDGILQRDGSTRVPHRQLWYDSMGNVVCSYANAADNSTVSVAAYDQASRIIAWADADDSTPAYQQCGKRPGIPGSAVVSSRTYFPDGSIATEQTPSQAARSVRSAYSYDLNGNRTAETHWTNNIANTMHEWYDGADRLVELQLPSDPSDLYAFPWNTRYLYDLSLGQTNSILGTSFRAYGGLAKVQEYLPTGASPTVNESGATGVSAPIWTDTTGVARDAVDRTIALYRNNGHDLQPLSFTYDANPDSVGGLSSSCNANKDSLGNAECSAFTYDERFSNIQTAFSLANTPARTYSYDPDGRMVGATSSVGAITDIYDIAGRKRQRTQTVTGVPSPATTTYNYYADSTRSSVDVQASPNYADLLVYSYRSDGPLQTLKALGQFTWTFAYSGGRRLLARTDPATVASLPSTEVFGQSGQVSSWGTPPGGGNGLTYDAQGLIQSMTATGSWTSIPTTFTATYSNRGEVLRELIPSPTNRAYGVLMANGVRAQTGHSNNSATLKPSSYSFNALTGYPMRMASPNTANAVTYPSYSTVEFSYDGAGRQSGTSTTAVTQDNDTVGSTQKTYDAEDHLLGQSFNSQVYPVNTGSSTPGSWVTAYAWGPLGTPFRVGGAIQSPTISSDSLFWDDDSLLFTVSPAGVVNDIKIGALADYVPGGPGGGLTIWDRDSTGQLFGCHNATGFGTASYNLFRGFTSACANRNNPGFSSPSTAPQKMVGAGGILFAQKSDGWSDGFATFQGVRTFDPKAGVWDAPDAYLGRIGDPSSNHPYMWNRNNPYSYSDPTGFDVEDPETLIPPDDSPSAPGWKPVQPPGLGSKRVTARAATEYTADERAELAWAEWQVHMLMKIHQHEIFLGGMENAMVLVLPGGEVATGYRGALAVNMARDGVKPATGEWVHHIVAWGHPLAEEARQKLIDVGIDISESINGALVTKRGSHPWAYYRKVNEELRPLSEASDVRAKLIELRQWIADGTLQI
jgi:YD repeat-containing protein